MGRPSRQVHVPPRQVRSAIHRPRPLPVERRSERGSALVIAVLVSVILALLGISFLLMGQTENLIAQNEKRSAQALYVAETGVRLVKRWFDEPGSSMFFPSLTQIDRNQREMVDESDPYNPALLIRSGDSGWVRYKNVVDTTFRAPYRGDPVHALRGTENGPDLVIDSAVSSHVTLLDQISQTLFSDFPAEGGGVHARISRIEVFAPPYIEVGGNWSRYGIGTVRVVGQIYQDVASGPRILGEREARVVLSEAPYQGPYGPLHSCSDMTLTGPLTVRWGAITAERDVRFRLLPSPSHPFDDLSKSVPRAVPGAPRVDRWWTSNPSTFTTFTGVMNTRDIADPWFRVLSGGEIFNAPSNPQPYPPVLPASDQDHSNLLQEVAVVGCPDYDYNVWRAFADSGERDVHYYAWAGGDTFREKGVGPVASFYDITADEEGVYFFDTQDGLPPRDVDGDGLFDNLTPEIQLPAGANWNFRGAIYLNAIRIEISTSVTGNTMTLRPPGEPFLDTNDNGQFDAGEPYINLIYPTTAATRNDALTVNDSGMNIHNSRGPAITGVPVAFRGILYTNGTFEASGSGTFYGSVIARQGVVQAIADGSAPTPEIYWDQSISDDWPPAALRIPRTAITGWLTERL